MVKIEDMELNSKSDETSQDLDLLFGDEHLPRAFASLLSNIEVEDVFGEFIVPSDLLSAPAKEAD